MPQEIYFEFTQIGNAIKVAAIDAKTGVEVSVMGSQAYDQAYLESLAMRKLQRRMAELQKGK
ncbi:MAG: serine hydroxymethyltransferase [Pseudomonadota bacterium]